MFNAKTLAERECEPFGSDAKMLAAEKEMAKAFEECIAECDDVELSDAFADRGWDIKHQIAATAPQTLAGAAAKLRTFLNFTLDGEQIDDANRASLRQVLDLVEYFVKKERDALTDAELRLAVFALHHLPQYSAGHSHD
jgi:hypothetical protein